MNQHRLPILADFLFLHNLLSEKSIDHQSFEAISSHIQKKFQKNVRWLDFISFMLKDRLISGCTMRFHIIDITDKKQ